MAYVLENLARTSGFSLYEEGLLQDLLRPESIFAQSLRGLNDSTKKDLATSAVKAMIDKDLKDGYIGQREGRYVLTSSGKIHVIESVTKRASEKGTMYFLTLTEEQLEITKKVLEIPGVDYPKRHQELFRELLGYRYITEEDIRRTLVDETDTENVTKWLKERKIITDNVRDLFDEQISQILTSMTLGPYFQTEYPKV